MNTNPRDGISIGGGNIKLQTPNGFTVSQHEHTDHHHRASGCSGMIAHVADPLSRLICIAQMNVSSGEKLEKSRIMIIEVDSRKLRRGD